MRPKLVMTAPALCCLLLAAGQVVAGQVALPPVENYQQAASQAVTLLRQGDAVWVNGNPTGGLPYYNQAYTLAVNTGEVPVLTLLAERYLRLSQPNAAVVCYAAAYAAAARWMTSDPARGPYYRYGFDALNHLIGNWNSVLNPMWPATDPNRDRNPTRNALFAWAQHASNTVVAASQPAPLPWAPQRPVDMRGAGTTVANCDRSGPNTCDVILVPRNPR